MRIIEDNEHNEDNEEKVFSSFYWELELPSSHRERISRQWKMGVKQTTLGCCARPENSLQKLLASDTVFGNSIKHKFVEHF